MNVLSNDVRCLLGFLLLLPSGRFAAFSYPILVQLNERSTVVCPFVSRENANVA